MYKSIILFFLIAALGAGGCSLLPEQEDETLTMTASQLYNTAKEARQNDDFEKAIKFYGLLETRYPFGHFAQQGLLELGYAHYRSVEPELAIATLERFARQYPTHPHIDYAYYLKGLVNFNRGIGIVDRLLPTDDTQRDPGAATDSFSDFATLARLYPKSQYVEDATQRMVHLRNRLAYYEAHVAAYYLERGAYVAAANRGTYIVEHFQGTPAVANALSIMIASYDQMGLTDLSTDTKNVLILNHPEHPGIANPGAIVEKELNVLWEWLEWDK